MWISKSKMHEIQYSIALLERRTADLQARVVELESEARVPIGKTRFGRQEVPVRAVVNQLLDHLNLDATRVPAQPATVVLKPRE